MKKLYILSLGLLACTSVSAQVVQAVSMSPNETLTSTNANAAQAYTVDKARKATFEYLKQAFSPYENEKLKLIPDNLDSVMTSQAVVDKASYANFMKSMTNLPELKKQLESAQNFDKVAQLKQISEFNKALSVKASAGCFSEQESGDYVTVPTLEGRSLVGTNLAPLRENPRYGLVENYSQGFARLSKDMVYGFRDLCGNMVIQPQYDYAEPFNDGKALVKKYYWHFIDTNGKESEVLKGVKSGKALSYGISALTFENNKVALVDNNYPTTNKPLSSYFDEIIPFAGNLFKVRNDKQFGLIKIDGTAVIDLVYDRIYLSETNKWVIIEKDKKVGLIDIDGNTRIKPSYESLISVNVKPEISNASSIIAKDEKGFRVIELNERKISDVYASIGLYNAYGLTKVCKESTEKGTQCGFMNYEGVEIIPTQYGKVSDFSKYGLVVVSEQNTNCSLPVGNCQTDLVYDHFGRIVLDKINPDSPVGTLYSVTDTLIAGTLVAVKTMTPTESGKFSEGFNLVNNITYSRFTKEPFELIKRFDKNYFAVRKNNVWGLIDNFGNEILAPTYMDLVHSSDGYFGVMFDNEKYGYIDETGKVRITFEYNEINPFNNGLAIVSKGKNQYGIINKFNAKVAPCQFKSIIYEASTQKYSLTERNDVYVLNQEGDCLSDNCKDFYDVVRKANAKQKN